MSPRRRNAVLGAALVASVALATGASALSSKFDPRLRFRRASAPSGGFSPMGGGGAAPAGPAREVLIRVAPGTPLSALQAAYPNAKFGSLAGNVATAEADDASLDAIAADARVSRVELSGRAHPTMDLVRSSSNVSGVALGTIYGAAATDLANATGSGVVVGIVDTGIDWTHRDFVIDASSTSRILYLWDQTISSHAGGPFPGGSWNYGAEYTQANITAKLQGGANVINEVDSDGHGTHVAGISAGDGTGTANGVPSGTFKGMAPSADIIFVRTTFSLSKVVDGINYIVNRAAAAGKRAVINLSLGTAIGSHDGQSSFEQAIGAVAASTPIVVALGNDGGSAGHAGNVIPSGGSSGYVVSVPGTSPDADVDFWFPGGDRYSVTVTLAGTGGSLTVPADSTGTLTFPNGDTVDISNSSSTNHPLGDEEIYVYTHQSGTIQTTQIQIQFNRTTAGGTGRVDGWLDPGQGISFASNVDASGTLGEPACANNVFGVSSYAGKRNWPSIDGNTYFFTTQASLGSLSLFSSVGPTRDGRQQPDVAAPGDVVMSALSSDPGANPGNTFIHPDGKHMVLRGTSMATPVVTGILAARLQWGPTRTVAQLRTILQGQARSDSATGSLPNYSFGYGKVASSPQPTSAPTSLTASTLGTSSITWNWAGVLGADSYNLYYATNPAQLVASGVQPPYSMTGLAANTTTGVLIKGTGAQVAGPGSFISTGTYALAPLSLPAITPYVSSAAASYTVCPAAPAASSCYGYVLEAATNPAFTGALSSATSNRALSSLSVQGLSPLTSYYFRLSTLNFFGAATSTGAVTSTTLTNLVAPTSPVFLAQSASSIRVDFGASSNPPGTVYQTRASTDPAYAGTLFLNSSTATFSILTGMSNNASYYFRLQATGGPFLDAGPFATLANPPALSTAPYSAVSQTGFTVQWSSGGNGPYTLYSADVSVDPAFGSVAGTSVTRNGYATFGGLTPNTVYYTRAQAISHGGTATAYATFGSTPTFVMNPLAYAATAFSNVGDGALTFSWTSGGNPGGTLYNVRISTDPAFATLTNSAQTSALSASFSNLDSNRVYYAAVAALNLSGSPTAFTAALSTATTVIAPVSAGVTGSAATSASVAWIPGRLGPGTNYQVQSSSVSDFSLVAGTSVTLNTFATVSGLASNTVQYLRVRAKSLSAQPDGAWTALGQISTLANAPTAAGAPFPVVGVTSVTVAWTALPLAPQSAGCESYVAEISADPAFSTIYRSSSVAPGAGQAILNGLVFSTLYYARVGAVNWDGTANYLTVGSTRTNTPVLSSGVVTGATLTLGLASGFPAAPVVTAQIDPGTFPPGTNVVMISGVSQDLSNPPSKVAKLTALAPSVGVEITAGGLQPQKPVRLFISYDPAQIPLGQSASRLVVARYDDPSGFWTLVPSVVDTRSNLILATLDHFSTYAPFFAVAGASVGDGVVFPQPWEVGDPSGPYGAQTLTFANYPSATRIRLMTLMGELVWEGVTGANGVLTWDGRNKSGRPAASGTYYAIIEGGNGRKVRRVAIVR